MTHDTTLLAARVLVLLFLLVLTATAAVDKVTDRKGNKTMLDGVFAKTPLKGFVGPLLTALTVLFIASALFLSAGLLQLLITKGTELGSYGALLTALTMGCLFLGQQVAKDHSGSTSVLPYFALSLVALFLLDRSARGFL